MQRMSRSNDSAVRHCRRRSRSADALHRLFLLLGCQRRGASWFYSEGRQLIFVSDLIDVGPEQRRTFETVGAVMDSGIAQAIMGNHEFNAICYATPDADSPGDYLRTHREPWGDTTGNSTKLS